jgi:hypothetical protein
VSSETACRDIWLKRFCSTSRAAICASSFLRPSADHLALQFLQAAPMTREVGFGFNRRLWQRLFFRLGFRLRRDQAFELETLSAYRCCSFGWRSAAALCTSIIPVRADGVSSLNEVRNPPREAIRAGLPRQSFKIPHGRPAGPSPTAALKHSFHDGSTH